MVMMAEKTKMMNDDARRVEPSDLEMGDWRLRCGDGYDDDEKWKMKIEDDESKTKMMNDEDLGTRMLFF